MDSLFNPEFFAGNRQKLRTLFTGKAPIVVTANGLLQKSVDTSFPFRQDSSFWYLTGIDEPDIILVLDKDKEYLILPERSQYQDIFDSTLAAEEIKKHSGIATVYDSKEGWKHLGGRLNKVKHVATLAAYAPRIDTYGMYSNPARQVLVGKMKEINPSVELLDLRPHLARLRMLKQPAELAVMKKAIAATGAALRKVSKKLTSYNNESEIVLDLTQAFGRRGAKHAFEPIVASGMNACTIHYVSNNSNIDKKGLVLLDIGAEIDHYGADISRTYSVGTPSKRQKQVFEAVKEAQQFAISLLKPGTIVKDYEKRIEEFMGEKLRELGLIKSIEKDLVRRYYPHSTSHSLGLDAHDPADYERPIEVGMVMTVEPGIYIAEEGIGVRIEDDVFIGKSGVQILSKAIPAVLQ